MKTEKYQLKFGEINFPEGFEEKLKGKTLEEQMKFYRITASSRTADIPYGKLDAETIEESCYSLSEYKAITGLIELDGILVGVRIHSWWDRVMMHEEDTSVLPYQRVCTYYASDNDGSGYKEREDYAYLICV